MSRKMAPIADGIQLLIRALYDESVAIDNMFEDGNATVIKENKLNDNFAKAEFQALWKKVNHKYAYTVHYNSNELIEKVAISINANLEVNQLRYVVVTGEQDSVDVFGNTTSTSKQVASVSTSTVKYDLVGEIAKGATLTRRTVVEILKKLRGEKLAMFQNNPEEFIRNVVKLIKEQKATMIVEHISYNLIEGNMIAPSLLKRNRLNQSAKPILHRSILWIMCLAIRMVSASSLRRLMEQQKFVYMQNYLEHSKYQPLSATMLPIGLLRLIREL